MRLSGAVLAALALSILQASAQTNQPGAEEFSFITAGDMRNFVGPAPAGKRYFDGACEALQNIGGPRIRRLTWRSPSSRRSSR